MSGNVRSRPSHQAKNNAQARLYAARVLSFSINPKKLAKRRAARSPASLTSFGTTIARPNVRAGSRVASGRFSAGTKALESLVESMGISHRPILATVLDDLEIGATAGGLLWKNMGAEPSGHSFVAHTNSAVTPTQSSTICACVAPHYSEITTPESTISTI